MQWPIKVMFLCTGNSCRSVLAEALLRHLGSDQFESYSAGSKPTGEIHPNSLKVLRNQGISTTDLKSQSWDEFESVTFDLVITVCDNANAETCPAYLGTCLKTHWGVFDPPKVDVVPGEELKPFEDVFEILKFRIEKMISLINGTKELSLVKSQLDEIGRSEPNG